MNKLALSAAAALLISGLVIAPSANAATLINNTISASYLFPDANTVPTGAFTYTHSTFSVTDPGVETTLIIANLANPSINDEIAIDFTAYAVTFTWLNAASRTAAAFNGPEFTITSGNPFSAITNVVSVGHTVSASLVGGVLEVNWAGQTFAANDTVVVNFASPVPELSTWAMMILGFAGVGYMTYRRRETAALAV